MDTLIIPTILIMILDFILILGVFFCLDFYQKYMRVIFSFLFYLNSI